MLMVEKDIYKVFEERINKLAMESVEIPEIGRLELNITSVKGFINAVIGKGADESFWIEAPRDNDEYDVTISADTLLKIANFTNKAAELIRDIKFFEGSNEKEYHLNDGDIFTAKNTVNGDEYLVYAKKGRFATMHNLTREHQFYYKTSSLQEVLNSGELKVTYIIKG